MSKFTKASEEIQDLVNEISNELGFAHMGIDFEAVCVNKAKEVAVCQKASAVAEYLTQREDLILVIVYEDAFDKLDKQLDKYMWLRMAMEQIVFDSEKDKVSIGVPSITLPVAFYEKYKTAAVGSALLAQLVIAQIEDEKKKKKEEEKAAKAGKNRKNKWN